MKKLRSLITATALALGMHTAHAASFSYTGTFAVDEQLQLFTFHINNPSSSVVIETLSQAGGVNSQGTTIAPGGFETYLALFDNSTGALLTDTASKSVDLGIDAMISIVGTLAAGDYTVALTEYDNIALGPTLSDGFAFDLGLTNFCVYSDTLCNGNDGHWALDINTVDGAAIIPEPAPLGLGLIGLAALWPFARRRAVPSA
ncbi:DVUA0089 family protein [Methylomagnum ishizawai]|uniref:DVUA0089 family protein n=1 Tax=Methylomagnum ishizawai TaxID=1760988 RepID=UPI001C336DE4|nr:DVUA0089 family protein [Methylomagnum ishizawai]BBL76000.1 hypothetical protein MishRS11D_30980 [Methylomagnum ishizawai]